MGTTLTGTTPQDTYDSLIKVTDNGPLSGTLKALSDGLGNDSTLSLSTTAASIAGTLAVTGNATFDTNTLFVDAANNRVGIGITTPDSKVRIQNDNATVPSLTIRDGGTPTVDHIRVSSGTYGDAFFVGATGNVGIGTSAPDTKLTTLVADNAFAAKFKATNGVFRILPFETGLGVKVSAVNGAENAFEALALQGSSHQFVVGVTEVARVTSNGLTFNGDTAAANALDDYEEGTFTPTFNGTTRTGGTLLARYTKIGRLVHFDIFLFGATFSGSSGPASIGGFPFTSNVLVYGQGLISYNNCVDGNTNGGYVDAGGTTFFPVDENNTTVASFIDGTADRNLMISGSYTV